MRFALAAVLLAAQPLSAHAADVSATSTVDAVTVFEAETPIDLIRSLRPDVLVKGGDYTIETVVGADDLLSWGGRVEIVPIVPGYSTTRTIARMNKP